MGAIISAKTTLRSVTQEGKGIASEGCKIAFLQEAVAHQTTVIPEVTSAQTSRYLPHLFWHYLPSLSR